MIMSRFDIVLPPQFIRHILAFRLGITINDPTFSIMMILDKFGDVLDDPLRFRSNFVFEIRSIERLGKDETVSHAEIVEDIAFDSIVGGSGEGDNGDSRIINLESSHLLVVGSCRQRVSVSGTRKERRDVRKSCPHELTQ